MISRDYDRGLVASPTEQGGLLRVLRFPPPAEGTEPGEGESRANQESLKCPRVNDLKLHSPHPKEYMTVHI